MSLPPALKAKMSLLVLAHLSFSLVRSGESWSPQAARQKESRCEEQVGREETNGTTEEKGDQVRWGVGHGEGSRWAPALAVSPPQHTGSGDWVLAAGRTGEGDQPGPPQGRGTALGR